MSPLHLRAYVLIKNNYDYYREYADDRGPTTDKRKKPPLERKEAKRMRNE